MFLTFIVSIFTHMQIVVSWFGHSLPYFFNACFIFYGPFVLFQLLCPCIISLVILPLFFLLTKFILSASSPVLTSLFCSFDKPRHQQLDVQRLLSMLGWNQCSGQDTLKLIACLLVGGSCWVQNGSHINLLNSTACTLKVINWLKDSLRSWG